MTLAQLRALLALSRGPAVERLTDRTPEGVARAYLPCAISVVPMLPADSALFWPDGAVAQQWDGRALSLRDPGTVNAVRVGLALAQGLDPTDGAIWTRITGGGWRLFTTGGFVDFDDFAGAVVGGRIVNAPAVLAEPDSTRALVLAVESVLSASSNLVQAV